MEPIAIIWPSHIGPADIANCIAREWIQSRDPRVCGVTAQLNLTRVEAQIIGLEVDNEIKCWDALERLIGGDQGWRGKLAFYNKSFLITVDASGWIWFRWVNVSVEHVEPVYRSG